MTVLETLLTDLPTGWLVTDPYVVVNWVLTLVSQSGDLQQAGIASVPPLIDPDSAFQIGHYHPDQKAENFVQLLTSTDAIAAAAGLATLNAISQPLESALTTFDAANWLTEQATDRTIALSGDFPLSSRKSVRLRGRYGYSSKNRRLASSDCSTLILFCRKPKW